MLRLPLSSLSMGNRRFAVWLLALLVFAQSVGASVLSTLGPAHVHKAARETVGLEYFDLHRTPTRTTSRPTQVLTAFGHFHSDGQPHRHTITAATITVSCCWWTTERPSRRTRPTTRPSLQSWLE